MVQCLFTATFVVQCLFTATFVVQCLFNATFMVQCILTAAFMVQCAVCIRIHFVWLYCDHAAFGLKYRTRFLGGGRCPLVKTEDNFISVFKKQTIIQNPTFSFTFPLEKRAAIPVTATKDSSSPKHFVLDAKPCPFPPPPLSDSQLATVIKNWCNASSADHFEESGCSVCGQLTLKKDLSPLSHVKNCLHILEAEGVTREPRQESTDPIQELKGPVLDLSAVPRLALCNGLWLGNVPNVLQGLTFYEKMLISRVRYTKNFVRVQKGGGIHSKMVSNVIAFENPIPLIYDILPPPKKDIEECLAVMFSDDYTRALLLVRRNVVANALHHLILNHADYNNLDNYAEDAPIVAVEYFQKGSNRNAEDDGNSNGDCVFTVHGIVGDSIKNLTRDQMIGIAALHLDNEGKFLRTSHAENPESLWQNPQLYPKMFPWLFPFGLGGIGSSNLTLKSFSESSHIKFLLLYHDKRFQLDHSFPFVAFSHQQIKASTSQSFLLAESRKFTDIILQKYIKPSTDAEIHTKTQGSISSKKTMQSEIWSLINHIGGPSWYVTLTPCDFKHPICIYHADTKHKFDCRLLLSNNPVAGPNGGLFGPTSGYYCTVEQQGRLALHMHGLIFNQKTLSPQEIRRMILDPSTSFQKDLVAFLESIRVGEFLTGSLSNVKAAVTECTKSNPAYISPERTLPTPPPDFCECLQALCSKCDAFVKWKKEYKFTVDDLLLKSNDKFETSCLNNRFKKCKARFPRNCFEETVIDPATGHIDLKKHEEWLNDISPALTYLIRGNTDVTSILSGTAIKSAVIYIADYITKTGLKTHVVFDSIKTIFDKSTEIISGPLSAKEKSRRLISRILELGSPMISLYLLQNPDHYTSHNFVPFYWKTYVSAARSAFEENEAGSAPKVVLTKRWDKLVGLSSSYDYTHRPIEHESYNLYDWVRTFYRISKRKKSHDEYSNHLSFTAGHPLHDTHSVSTRRNASMTIPNFIGSLPRPDKDDREYYCCTMLVLFHPWRSGENLKTNDQSWHDTFENCDFAPQCLLYMKNMNIRFECLDARDDFRTQLKSGKLDTTSLPSSVPFHSDEDLVGRLGEQDKLNDDQLSDNGIPNFELYNQMEKGKLFLRREAAMNAMKNILFNSGWVTPIKSDVSHEHLSKNCLMPLQKENTQHWNLLLKAMRDEILSNRQRERNAPAEESNNHNKKPPGKYQPDVVQICDKSYFENLGVAYGSVKELALKIIQQNQLTYEQERAFQIVAQHSIGLSPDSLQLYIGGMGGTGKSQVIKSILNFFAERNNSFAIVISAPTGGSTYHFLLGFNNKVEEVGQATMAQVCARLDGVQYMILDELSMLSCYDLYRISAQLCKVILPNFHLWVVNLSLCTLIDSQLMQVNIVVSVLQ
ncbi:MAG: hypothetical protein NXY57DRAFT_1046468 [Lentinula lateritia]|nr:MAG: hypothetical protein NXY57DRAFT_1046468 [Lentinula lateritia]